MSADELGLKYFTRDRVKNRMLKRAAEVWGYTDPEMDEFDPLVTLLIEACALEIERIGAEIGKTQNRMMERLAQLLYPDMTIVRPAYGIAQAISAEPYSTIPTDTQLTVLYSASDRKKGEADLTHFFSPVRPTRLVNGTIRYQASSREIYAIENGIQKLQMATAIKKNALHQHSLWLGLELDADIDSLDGISVFFNWRTDADADTWYQHLPYTQWRIKTQSLDFVQGLPVQEDKKDPVLSFEQEFDSMKRIEEEVLPLFNRQFITIQHRAVQQPELPRENYPPAFEQWFDKKDLQEMQEPLTWIEIKFPTMVVPEAIDNVLCGINCFPVLARRLNKRYYKLQQNLNIFPLESEGSFLSIKEIADSRGQSIKLIPFGNPYDLQPETYTLRYGVNRFNERNSYETLINLLDLVREESSFFSSLGEEFLVQHIRDLNHILARMESKVKLKNKHESPFPFLAIQSAKDGANVMIEFWSCHGEAANKIPTGVKMMPYENTSVRGDSIYMMTTTHGGRDSMSDADKLTHYKKALFTRNRIVTTEDLRAVITAELGSSIKSVDIHKSFMKGALPGEGFVRYVQVLITPHEDDRQEITEWEQKLQALKVTLDRQSAGNIPYHISLIQHRE